MRIPTKTSLYIAVSRACSFSRAPTCVLPNRIFIKINWCWLQFMYVIKSQMSYSGVPVSYCTIVVSVSATSKASQKFKCWRFIIFSCIVLFSFANLIYLVPFIILQISSASNGTACCQGSKPITNSQTFNYVICVVNNHVVETKP